VSLVPAVLTPQVQARRPPVLRIPTPSHPDPETVTEITALPRLLRPVSLHPTAPAATTTTAQFRYPKFLRPRRISEGTQRTGRILRRNYHLIYNKGTLYAHRHPLYTRSRSLHPIFNMVTRRTLRDLRPTGYHRPPRRSLCHPILRMDTTRDNRSPSTPRPLRMSLTMHRCLQPHPASRTLLFTRPAMHVQTQLTRQPGHTTALPRIHLQDGVKFTWCACI
jgi:hypothetical protein